MIKSYIQKRPRGCRNLFGSVHILPALAIVSTVILFSNFTVQQEADPVMLLPEYGIPVYETYARIDIDNKSLEVSTAFTYLADEITSKRIGFFLNGGLEISDITGPMVKSHRYEPFQLVPLWNHIEVELAKDAVPGDTIIVMLEYKGQLEFEESHSAEMFTSDWIDLNLDTMWHPIFDGFDQYMRGILRLSLPDDWEVVASGPGTFQKGVHVITNQIPQIDIAFAASPAFRTLRTEGLAVYFNKASDEAVAAVLEGGDNCIGYLNERYGTYNPIPFAKLIMADRAGHAYARKNYIVLSTDDVDPNEPVRLHRFICHELAHYWTPSPGPFSPDHWMSEAFAELVAGRFIRDHFGEELFDLFLSQWKNQGRHHGPVWTPELKTRPGFELMYRRAPYLLYLLEEEIGKQQFERFLYRYMTEDVLTTPELLDRLEAVSGPEAKEWFRKELARTP